MATAVSRFVGHQDPWMHSLSALANLTLCLGVSDSSPDVVRACSTGLVVTGIVSFFSGIGAVSGEGDLFSSLAVGEDMSG